MEHKLIEKLKNSQYIPVSVLAPFISNLNIIDNITLVTDVHKSFLQKSAKQEAKEKLTHFGLESKAHMYHDTLGNHNTFLVHLIRASMMEDKSIIIDRPFLIAPTADKFEFFMHAIETLEIDLDKIIVYDLESMKRYYNNYTQE